MDNKPITLNQILFNLFIIILGYNYSDVSCFTIFSIYTIYEMSYFNINDRYNIPVFNNFIKYYGIGIVLEKISIYSMIGGILLGSMLSTIISFEIIYDTYSKLYDNFINLMNIVYNNMNFTIPYLLQKYIVWKQIIINFINKFRSKDNKITTTFSETESETESDNELENKLVFDQNIETTM